MRLLLTIFALVWAGSVSLAEPAPEPDGPAPRTLEDIYLDTGNSFRAAIGFLVEEGTAVNQAMQSYGLAVDDVALEWREYTLEDDLWDCETGGSCAVVELATNAVFQGQTVVPVTVLEATPQPINDCDLDTVLDGTDDCSGNGTPDVVIRATSAAEPTGEIYFLDRQGPADSSHWAGQVPISTIDSPGTLYVQRIGTDDPIVTITYLDSDDGTGSPCPNDVDPAKHGRIQSAIAVVLGPSCAFAFVDSLVSDNGDHDIYADTGETIDMRVSYLNSCGIEVHDCTARLFTNSPEVDCIIDPAIHLGTVPFDGEVRLSAEAFRWKLADDVERSDVDEQLTVEFGLSVTCDEFDSTLTPQTLTLDLDLDVDLGGQTELAWTEGFETGTLGKFETENLDVGIPGANNEEGHVNGNGWRCQYSDPNWVNSNSYGSDAALDCFPGVTLNQADSVFWQVDGSGQNLCDTGRAKTGLHSLHYGICLTAPAGVFTTPLSTVESVRTTDPINLGVGSEGPTGTELQLSWWQQVSINDGTFLTIPDERSSDRGVVEVKTVDAAGNDTSDWTRLEPFQNSYDAQAYDFFFNCMFDPVDDGNNEDDFFDPQDPERRLGPSSTCFPEFTYARLGNTHQPFSPQNIGRATTPPGVGDEPSLGLGTWVESRVNLTEFRGRRVKLRFLVSSIKATAETHEEQFDDMLGQWYDDGWWIDDLRIDATLTSPAQIVVDDDVLQACAGDDRVGCLTEQDCLDAGVAGPCDQPAPDCGPVCDTIDLVVATQPDTTGGALAETLAAPGQAIVLDAAGSSGICQDGALQFRFSIDGGGPVLREWSENPAVIDAPQQDADYLVEARCSIDHSCNTSQIVDVDVNCPSSGNLQTPFPETIRAQTGKTEWAWITSVDFDLFHGDLAAVGSYAGSLATGTGSAFSDPAVPAAGAGTYYVVRTSGEYCNDKGLWTSQGPGESPLRETSLP